MRGRIEHQIELEDKITQKIIGYPSCLSDFYYAMTTNRKSHTTKNVYVNNLIHFIHFLSMSLSIPITEITNEHLYNVNTQIIDRYLDSCRWKKKNGAVDLNGASYLCTKLSALNYFFSFLTNRNFMAINPIGDRIERPSMGAGKDIVYLNEHEINTVIANIQETQTDWTERNMLLFLIPICTGLRVTALDEINLEDISINSHTIIATDKRDKTSTHYFDDSIASLLRTWLYKRNKILDGKDSQALFISNQKTRMHTNSIRNIVSVYTSNLDKHIMPHKLRATCATTLYKNTHDIYLVAEVLGHSSTNPTKKYTKIEDSRKQEVPNIIAESFKFKIK